jgi:cytidine deaminase
MSDILSIPHQSVELTESIKSELLEQALQAQENAYCPYSNFPVGAAVLTADGKIFSGCNVENASYGLTVCAERSAVFSAIGSGATKIVAIALITNTDPPRRPCGACRQVIAEFSDAANPTVIISKGKTSEIITETIDELLPETFALI